MFSFFIKKGDNEMKQIQWFPGHMKKTLTEIETNLKLVDIVIELRDARVPLSSQNPMLTRIVQDKKRLIVLTKKDLADPGFTKLWLDYFRANGADAIAFDVHRDNVARLVHMSEQVLKDKFARDAARGLKKRPIKAMIVGVPNVGKSTLINKVAHKKVATVGNKPGVTKTNQWIRLHKDMELLDTPGVLYPKFENERVGLRLAAVGTIKDTIVPLEMVCDYVLDILKAFYPGSVSQHFFEQSDTTLETKANDEIITAIGRRRGIYSKGSLVDETQVMLRLLQEFRSGKIARVCLDRAFDEAIADEA